MEELRRASLVRGGQDLDLALLTDGLRAEREQGITIDVAYRYFSTRKRGFIIADTPGHEQYTRNMVTGASTADLAVILIDARNGVSTQSRRHAIIGSLLGIPRFVVCVNKMDLVGWSCARYEEIVSDFLEFGRKLNVHDIKFIPVSALLGDNVVDPGPNMPWYGGEPLLGYLENVTTGTDRNLVDFRFPVQCVVRPNQDFRGFAGRIVSGTVKVGEQVVVLPSRMKSRVRGIHFAGQSLGEACEGRSVIITLEDEIDVGRGDMLVRAHNIPEVSGEFDAMVAWMDDARTFVAGKEYLIQHTTRLTKARADDILYRMDVDTLHRHDVRALGLNEIGRVKFTSANPLFFDPYSMNRRTGGFIIIDPHDFRTVGAGMIRHASRETIESLRRDGRAQERETTAGTNIRRDPGHVGPGERSGRLGHPPRVVWFTGVSGSGKSTIAGELERRLWQAGKSVVRLDGDDLRHGLNADLGFGREDRRENIRRTGHVARLLYDFGHIVLCTFISPYREDRDRVRALFPEGGFVEVYVKVSPGEARRRDPKGLYARADAGEIRGFTGVDAPYEEPERPDLVIDSTLVSVDDAVGALLSLPGMRK